MHELHKIDAKKSLGQHFLTSPVVPTWMCDAADLKEGEVVLEIGPGTGVLTREILKRGATVIALEADLRAIEALQATFAQEIAQNKLFLYHTDVRELALEKIEGLRDHQYKVVANIPYYLSGHLFRSFLQTQTQPKSLVFLVQKEVAKRITEDLKQGGKESILSLSVKAYSTPIYVRSVSKGHFTPPPKIDSAVILVKDINRAFFAELREAFFFEVLHIGFGQKRKQLLGNLSKYYEREALTHIFSTLELSISVRAEDIPLEKWLDLSLSLQKLQQSPR